MLEYRQVINILKLHNYLVGESIINGGIYNFKGIGSFSIKRMPSNHNRKIIDWKESKKGKDGKYEEIVYDTSDEYLLIYWDKYKKLTKGYRFTPSKGHKESKGNIIGRLWRKYRNNEIDLFNFNIHNNYVYRCFKDGILFKTYYSIDDLFKDFNKSKYPNIKRAAINNTIAYGFNWKISNV